ncbi:unnamed protein product, partial [Meganyctiphanes norvegica]
MMRGCWLVLCLSVGLGWCLVVSEEDTPVLTAAAAAVVSTTTTTTAGTTLPTSPPTTPTRIAKAAPPTHDDVEQTTPMTGDDHGSTRPQDIFMSTTSPTTNIVQQITTKSKPLQKENFEVDPPSVKTVPVSPKPVRETTTTTHEQTDRK